jgi:hypothetical protein
MQSNFEIFRFAPNSRARVRSTAFLHPQFQTRQMTCFSHSGSWVFSLALGLAEVRYDLFEGELESELWIPSLRKEFPAEKFQ